MVDLNRRDFWTATLSLSLGATFSRHLNSAEPKKFSFFEPVNPPRSVQIMAHRGMAMLAPENSARAVTECATDFVEWAEVDVRLTKEGQHIIFHDDRLDTKTNGKGSVDSHTLAQLQELDAGSWFAKRFQTNRLLSLPELLALAKGKVNLYLDCKSIDPELLVKEIKTAQMENQVVVFGTPALLAAVRKASQGAIPLMAKYRSSFDWATFVKEVAPHAVEIDADELTAELCRKFFAQGIKVQAKVLGTKQDQPETWQKLIAAGVDWIQTDDPAGVAITALRRRIPKWPVMLGYHRGANRYAPENTLPAIKKAVAMGADFVEIDVRTTKDGQLVLMHDSTVDRTTNGTGKVRDLTLAEIRKLDAGSWFSSAFRGTQVPTLDEALAALGDKTAVYLDAKDISPEAVLAALKEHNLLERHVVYQSLEYAQKLQALDKRLRPLPPLRTATDFPKVAEIKPYGVDLSWRLVSKEWIDACHEKGIKVFSDALGLFVSVDQQKQAIAWGIDLIQTDYPLRVLHAIERVQKN
jgi:glycerophosphoryl diester phosphodiesterase